MRLKNPLRQAQGREARSAGALSIDDYFALMNNPYALIQTYDGGNREAPPNDFAAIVETIYKRNGIVFACMAVRQLLFSEARFQYRKFTNGRPGDLFGDRSLTVLEHPWPNGTTGELLARMEQDASLAGNFYATLRPGPAGRPRVRRLRPDWVTIILGSENDPALDAADLDAEIIGYLYAPPTAESVMLLPDEVCHYSPMPDPTANYRGMSWLTPVIRELEADSAATIHKQKFFTNGATPNMVVSYDPTVSEDQFKRFKKMMDDEHKGVLNAYKTLYLGGDADVKIVGNSFQQMTFKEIQGAGESRIASAAGVPPVIAGFSEGLQAATYSNYAQARRRFADGTIRPLWRMAAASLSTLVEVPGGAELWYDDRDIAFLMEDMKDRAEILGKDATTIRTLADAGFEPDSVIDAVAASDLTLLKGNHSGLFSVQLQPPGTLLDKPAAAAGPAAPDVPAVASAAEDLLVELRHSDEVDALRQELADAKAGKSLTIIRDEHGRALGMEMAGSDATS